MPEASFYAQFLVFAAWFLGHPPTCSLMSATPGFRFMLARAWVLFPQLNGPDDAHSFEPRLSSLCCCIATFDFVNPANVAEMIDGAGGSIDDLARLVIQYTDDVFGAERSRTIESNAGYFRGLLKFLQAVDSRQRVEKNLPDDSLGELYETLFDHHEFAPRLVAAMSSLQARSSPKPDSASQVAGALRYCFVLMERVWDTSSGYRRLADAIRADLLRVIMTCATAKYAAELGYYLIYLVHKVLPQGLLHYYVVDEVAVALVHLEDVSSDEEFQATELFDDWDMFIYLADARIAIMDELRPDSATLRACDNIEVRVLSK